MDVSCCSSRSVPVHGGGGDSLLAITLIGLALSCHPSSLHSHAFLIAIALNILTFLHFRSQSALLSFLDPITIALIGLTKATLSRLLPFSPSWSLFQWPIVIALQNLGPLISAYFVSEKIASHLSTNQMLGLLLPNAFTPAPPILIGTGPGRVISYPYRHLHSHRHSHRHSHPHIHPHPHPHRYRHRPTRWVFSKLEAS